MKKILPLMLIVLVITTGILLKRGGITEFQWASLGIKFPWANRMDLDVKHISLFIAILISGIILLGGSFSKMFSISLWFILGSILTRLLIFDIVVNIKSLSWLPEIHLSYLTVVLASMIIILSLLIDNRSINE